MENVATQSDKTKLEKLNYIATACTPEQINELYKAFLEYSQKTK
ncbi:hypothetical protein DES34_112198 [Brevibacillus brevis]|nr:hypothetical protein DES34_112198 [Brevibacillus brevis]GEC93644.1 hypothetical protein BBR01nite_59750 [Brevibacillus brevis]VEF87224.1 Uncharacterised protein [Brevibacillus brevis]